MDKPRNKTLKKLDYKKKLVRNTELSVPKTIVSYEPQPTPISDLKLATSEPPQEKGNLPENFEAPELYTTLKLSKKLDALTDTRKTKSFPEIDKKKLAIDEKISRKVNFPFDQPIYKDLIPLTCSNSQFQPVVVSRGPSIQKDKEPDLSQFLEPKKMQEYYFQPNVMIRDSKTLPVNQSNLRLYKLLQIHSENK